MSDKRFAPEGKIWVCGACGKTAKDNHGGKEAMYGWDVSCAINSFLVDENLIVRGPDKRVIEIKEGISSSTPEPEPVEPDFTGP